MMRPNLWSSVVVVGVLAVGVAVGCGAPPPPKQPELDADPPLGSSNTPGAGVVATEVQRAAAFIKAEKWADAREHLDKALAQQPKSADANYYMGLVKEKTGDRDGAIESYKKALAADGALAEAANNLAAMYLDNPPKPDEAIPLLQKALEKTPDDPALRRNLAYAYGLKGDVPAASKEYETVLAKNDDPAIRLDYATLLFEKKDLDHAAAELKKTLDKIGDDAAVLSTIGLMLGYAKAYGDCVRAFDRALKLQPVKGEWLVRRGTCRHGLKDEPGARADFEAATKADPKSAAAHYYLGESLLQDKKRNSAFDELDKAVDLAGDSEIGKAAKARLATMEDVAAKRKAAGIMKPKKK